MAETPKDGVVEGMVPVKPVAAPGSIPDIARPKAAKRALPPGTTSELPAGATLLDRTAIVAQKDKPRRRLYVPAFGGTVCLLAMKSVERDAYEASLVLQVEGGKQTFTTQNIRAKLVCRMIVDEFGSRVFTDEDADLLGELPADEMDKLWAAGQSLSGVSEADVKVLAGN
jgi:hypothetical protein